MRRSFQDLLDARPPGRGAVTMWVGGVGLAFLPLAHGLNCMITQRGRLGTTLWGSTVEGMGAVALGIGWIGVAAFLHFHFFFALHPRLAAHSALGKRVSLIAAAIGLTTAGVWSMVARLA